MDIESDLQTVAGLLAHSRRVLFITGAGMSAESGLPTYRGIGGLYDSGATEEGMSIEEALSGVVFRRRPEISWKYISQLEASCRGAKFNRGHELIAKLDETHEVVVLTQNVDGFHAAAGSRNVIAIHGDLHDLRCTRCQWTSRVPDYSELQPLPTCPECGAVIRPAVVLFGEMLPLDRVEALSRELMRGFDIVFSVGTSSVFPYIAGPVFEAAHRGIPTVEINPGRSEVSDVVRYRFSRGSGEVLERIVPQ